MYMANFILCIKLVQGRKDFIFVVCIDQGNHVIYSYL